MIRASLPESRERNFRPASGGGLRMAIDAPKLDSFVQVPIAKRSYESALPIASRTRGPWNGFTTKSFAPSLIDSRTLLS